MHSVFHVGGHMMALLAEAVLHGCCFNSQWPHAIFLWWNPSGFTMALGLTQSLTKTSTRNIFWGGKGGWCVGLTTLPPSCADCHEILEPQPPGTHWACPGLYRGCFTVTIYLLCSSYMFQCYCLDTFREL